MPNKPNTATGVYKYLHDSGILDTGTDADIEQKRKEYWRVYKQKWKQEKRARETEFKIYLADDEMASVAKAAERHRMSRTRYLKEAALAYSAKRYLLPESSTITHIKRLLELNYGSLAEIADGLAAANAEQLLATMTELSNAVVKALCDPQSLHEQP